MPLRLEGNVPRWVQAQCVRSYNYSCLGEWDVKVRWLPADELPASGIYGYTRYWPEYRRAEISLSDTLKRNAFGKGVIEHEFRHLFYASLLPVIQGVIDLVLEHELDAETAGQVGERYFRNEIERIIDLDLEARGFLRSPS